MRDASIPPSGPLRGWSQRVDQEAAQLHARLDALSRLGRWFERAAECGRDKRAPYWSAVVGRVAIELRAVGSSGPNLPTSECRECRRKPSIDEGLRALEHRARRIVEGVWIELASEAFVRWGASWPGEVVVFQNAVATEAAVIDASLPSLSADAVAMAWSAAHGGERSLFTKSSRSDCAVAELMRPTAVRAGASKVGQLRRRAQNSARDIEAFTAMLDGYLAQLEREAPLLSFASRGLRSPSANRAARLFAAV